MKKTPEMVAARRAIDTAKSELREDLSFGERIGLRQPTLREHAAHIRSIERVREILARG